MSKDLPPVFPERALPSKAVLYRPLQDISIYVEDEGSEAFYKELFNRLVGEYVKIATVIPLRGRNNVIDKAHGYTDSHPALFLIDGDLYWVAGLPLPMSPNIYVHSCYCVENYLFCEKAMKEIVVESLGTVDEEYAQRILEWENIRIRVQEHLVPLFIDFAVTFKLCPAVETVASGLGCLLTQQKRGLPEIDKNKVNKLRSELRKKTLAISGVSISMYERERLKIEKRVQLLPDPIDIVSGKDFLIPIQRFEVIKAGGVSIKTESFIFRLVRHCGLEKMEGLRQKVFEIMGLDIEGAAS